MLGGAEQAMQRVQKRLSHAPKRDGCCSSGGVAGGHGARMIRPVVEGADRFTSYGPTSLKRRRFSPLDPAK